MGGGFLVRRVIAVAGGLTIGLGRCSCIFAAEGADKFSAGWRLQCAPMPARPAMGCVFDAAGSEMMPWRLVSWPSVLSARPHCGAKCSVTMVAIASVLVGCAPGSAGLVSGEVLKADGARVIVVRGYGFQLRGEPSDAGLTLGYARRTYIYPENATGFPEATSYWFWVPQPETPPVAWAGEAIGLDLRAGTSNWGITLGYRGTAVFAQVPAGETVRRRLRFVPDDPGSTQLRYCRGEDECASVDFTFDGET